MKLNGLLVAGFVIDIFVSFGLYANYSSRISPRILLLVLIPSIALLAAGMAMIARNKAKAGAIVYIIGSIVFMPIGLVGGFGARKVFDELKQKEINGVAG